MSSSIWPVHIDPTHLYFITTSAVQRAPVFHRDIIKRILVDSLNTGRILGQYALFAFVIMPNHIHFLIRCANGHSPIEIVREFKKATANLILRQYEMENNEQVLTFLASVARTGQEHQIWEQEYQAKNVYSPDFLREKLNYLHNNPLQPHWRLAENAEEYIWSSARFYLTGGKALIPLSDARELL